MNSKKISSDRFSKVASCSVYWEGTGLSNLGSGVAVFAEHLKTTFEKMGIFPKVLGLGRHGIPALKPIAPSLSFREAAALQKNEPQKSSGRAIFHGLSNFNLPWFGVKPNSGFRFVLTVHDLIPLLSDAEVSTKLSVQLKLITPAAFKVADAIVCSSEWSKKTLLSRFPQYQEKVRVVRLSSPLKGLGHREKSKEQKLRILSVSRNEGYKRLSLLLKIAQSASFPLTVDIVTDRLGQAQLQNQCEVLGLTNKVKIHCGLSDSDLSVLYERADVYAHPSIYEGYCLPAAEAMSYGVPVVYCAGSAVDELVGAQGLALERIATPERWVSGIKEAALLSTNQEWLVDLRRAQMAFPSWQDCAFSYADIYAKLLE